MIQRDASKMTALAPSWVMKAIARNSLPPNTLLNLKLLKAIISAEDLFVVYSINQDPAPFFGVVSVCTALERAWSLSDPQALADVKASACLHPGLKDPRLYAEKNSTQVIDAAQAFSVSYMNVTEMADPVILIKIHQGQFDMNRPKLQEECRRSYLQQLYVFLNSKEIAESSIFGRFIFDL